MGREPPLGQELSVTLGVDIWIHDLVLQNLLNIVLIEIRHTSCRVDNAVNYHEHTFEEMNRFLLLPAVCLQVHIDHWH